MKYLTTIALAMFWVVLLAFAPTALAIFESGSPLKPGEVRPTPSPTPTVAPTPTPTPTPVMIPGPCLTLIAPTNGATVSGASVAVTVTDTCTGVGFHRLYIDVLESGDFVPNSRTWNSTTVPTGTHSLEVLAWDVNGFVVKGRTGAINIIVSNGATPSPTPTPTPTPSPTNTPVATPTPPTPTPTPSPTVHISAPANGATIANTVSIIDVVTGVVTSANYYIDGNFLATVVGPAYTFSWNTASTANGAHTIATNAYNTATLVASDSISVTVSNASTPTATPTPTPTPTATPTPVANCIVITAPAAGATLSNAATVTVTDTCVGSSFHRLYVGNKSFQFNGNSFSWDTTTVANGSWGLNVIAWDVNGFIVEGNSAVVNVIINNPTPTPTPTPSPTPTATPTPAVTFVSPLSGATVIGPTNITVTTTGAISFVNFYIDGVFLISPPTLTTVWDTTAYTNASHTLLANAYNAGGMQVATASEAVTVLNALPSAISLVGRAQNNNDAQAVSVNVVAPVGIADGDLMVVALTSFVGIPDAQAGWTEYPNATNVTANAQNEYMGLYWRVWHTGDPGSFTFGHGQLNYPLAVMRVYRGATGMDASAQSPAMIVNTQGTSFNLPALTATAQPNDEYVGFWSAEPPTGIITPPGDLGHGTAQNVQWLSFDGDKVIPAAGTTPGTETASSTVTSNWIGYAVTLLSAATAPTPTPTATPTPTPTPTPIASLFVDSSLAGYNKSAAPTGACGTADLGPGTIGSPLCTMAAVQSKQASFTSDTAIKFKRGDVWSEQLTLNNIQGTSGHPVVLTNYGSGLLPVIDGSSTRNACIQGSGTVKYLTIDGFECRNTTKVGISFINTSAAMPGITVTNSFIHNTGAGAYAGATQGRTGVFNENCVSSPPAGPAPCDDGNYNNQLEVQQAPATSAAGTKFINNVVNNVGGHNAIQIHADSASPLVQGNTCGPLWVLNCIDLKAVVGAVVDGNLVNGSGIETIGSAGLYTENPFIANETISFTRNVVYGTPIDIQVEAGFGNSCAVANCDIAATIANNTLAEGSAQSNLIVGGLDLGNGFSIHATVRNNIFDGGDVSVDPAVTWTANHNDCGGKTGHATYNSTAAVCSGIRFDLINVDPTYGSYCTNDLSLQHGSPVANAGVPNLVDSLTSMGYVNAP